MPFAFIRVGDGNGFNPEKLLCQKLNEKYPNAEIVHLTVDNHWIRAIIRYNDDSETPDEEPIKIPESWQERLIQENNDLQFRINSLRDFLTSNRVIGLMTEEIDDLLEQLNLMVRLQKILQKRIDRFRSD